MLFICSGLLTFFNMASEVLDGDAFYKQYNVNRIQVRIVQNVTKTIVTDSLRSHVKSSNLSSDLGNFNETQTAIAIIAL